MCREVARLPRLVVGEEREAALVGPAAAVSVGEIIDNPARYLARGASTASRSAAELTTLALMRMASNDPEAAAGQLGDRKSVV